MAKYVCLKCVFIHIDSDLTQTGKIGLGFEMLGWSFPVAVLDETLYNVTKLFLCAQSDRTDFILFARNKFLLYLSFV